MAARTLCANSLLICLWTVSNGAVAVAERVPAPPTPAASLEQQPVAQPNAVPATRQATNGPTCGDDACDESENCVNCPADCGECDPPIVEAVVVDSTTADNPPGTKSCQVKLRINAPAESLLAVGDVDIQTSDPAGFFQHPLGVDTSPSCDFLPVFPDLSQDSYVTLAVECADGSDETSVGPDFDPDLFNNGGGVVGSWLNFNPLNGQGDPDADGNVLIAQFTIGQKESVSGTVTAFVKGDFGLPPPLGNPDTDGSGDVGPLDLATLLGGWGPHDPCPPFVPGDLDQDCDIDLVDLIILLDAWGPIGDQEPVNVTAVQVSFECAGAGPICGDGVCDEGENCVSCLQDCGECDPPLVEIFTVDSTSVDNPDGTKSCQVKLHLNAPAEKLLLVGDVDIETSDPAGFFQHRIGSNTPPSCDFLPVFEGLSQDSYVTITEECIGLGTTLTGPDFSSVLFNDDGRVVGSWLNSDPPNGLGEPDAEGNLLIAQFTVGQEENVCGNITAFVQGEFGLPPFPGNPDIDGGGVVGPSDLATLFGGWGETVPCPPFDPGDLDQDCDVDVVDLAILLDAWGTDGSGLLNLTTVELSFECPGPGPPCFVEVPTISKWTQAPEENAGTTLESNVDLQTLADQPAGETGDGPNAVVADDFRSDGRPITAVRWWGAYLDSAFEPEGKSEIDGWMISFHADGTDDPADPIPAELLSLYFCPAFSVLIETTEITDSAGRDVFAYASNLEDCCLTHTIVDERDLCDGCTCDFNDNSACEQTDLDLMHGCAGEPDWPDVNCNGESDVADCGVFLCLFGGGSQEDCGCPVNPVPAGQLDGFHEVAGFQYWLDVQAVVGQVFVGSQCIPLDTANSAADPFWGWYSSPDGCFDTSVTSAVLSPPDPADWQFEDWATDQVVDQAFELLTLRAPCMADFAGGPQSSPDGEVGPADLASLLANWGPAPKCAPPFFRFKVMDFNTDENVGPFDLAQLLALWGPCPCNVNSDCPSDVCLEDGDCEPL